MVLSDLGLASDLYQRAGNGDARALGLLLSLVENGTDVDPVVTGRRSPIIGITGPPGAGKSTLTARVIEKLRLSGDTVAALAIDPSSPFTGGALLGDRVRMQQHMLDPCVFVRSMASRGQAGGLAVAAPAVADTLSSLYDRVLLETVGVGQVELAVAEVADTIVLVLAPGWGDEVQADKAGILEIADIYVVNKADQPDAAKVRADLKAFLSTAPEAADGWRRPVLLTSRDEPESFSALVEAIDAHGMHRESLPASSARRIKRRRIRVLSQVEQQLEEQIQQILSTPETARLLADLDETPVSDVSEHVLRELAIWQRFREPWVC